MTDRELLEMAAKAAGIGVRYTAQSLITKTVFQAFFTKDGYQIDWSPLTDDGDALRLAVKVLLTVEQEFDRVSAYRDGILLVVEYIYDLPTPTDRNVATRRAIVRAGAEIGKATHDPPLLNKSSPCTRLQSR